MRVRLLLLIVVLLFSATSTIKADEGMWIPLLLNRNIADMQSKGCQLTAEDIYAVNKSSLKDAVVIFGGGCTGEVVSSDGLLFTNHHCGYGQIQYHSSVEHDYLTEGFWARSRDEELPNKGLSVKFLLRIADVTDSVFMSLTEDMSPEHRSKQMSQNIDTIVKYAQYNESLHAVVKPFYDGNQYFLYLYEVFEDVRLVGAPPSAIGKFGGDTDNWEWPQHKGDFAIYRIYTAPDGSPADYSEENVPMKPRKVLKISDKGVKKGDFTMILGYPGSTNRYNSSFGINKKEKLVNPITTKIRGEKLEIMDKWMSVDPAVRLLYADKYFGISNGQEFWSGEITSFRRYGVRDIRREDEKELKSWIMSSPERVEKWGDLLDEMEETYNEVEEIERDILYYRETMISNNPFFGLSTRLKGMFKKGIDSICPAHDTTYMTNLVRNLSAIDFRVEKDLLYYSLKTYTKSVESSKWGERLKNLMDKFGQDPDAVMDYVWENSIFTDESRLMEAVEGYIYRNQLETDPIYDLLHSHSFGDLNQQKNKIMMHGRNGKGKKHGRGREINALEKEYTHAMYEMRLDKGVVQYPDANSTMRLTYGTVGPINPFDGVYCSETSTTQGILDKYNPEDYEFTLKEKQLSLKANPTIPVNFLSNNDITGGNSGSPVLNARGELIGLAFDGNKESLCSDAYFHPDYCKTVSVDIRYVLWILKYYAEADHILQELEF